MIKNIIFDMVGVVIRFDTEKYYNDHGIGITDRELLKREVFGSLEWTRQDRGTISDDEVIERICVRVPERLHYVVRDFARRENREILQVEGMENLLADLKTASYYEKVILMRMNENVIAEAAGIDCQHCAYFGCTHEYIVPNFRT